MCENGWNDRDAVWDMGSIPQWEVAILGVKGLPILKYGDALLWAVQKWLSQSSSRLGWGLGWAQGTILDGGPDPPLRQGCFEGEGVAHCIGMLLTRAVQKQLNWSGCRLRWGFSWAQGPWGLDWALGPRNHVLDAVQIPHGKGEF